MELVIVKLCCYYYHHVMYYLHHVMVQTWAAETGAGGTYPHLLGCGGTQYKMPPSF